MGEKRSRMTCGWLVGHDGTGHTLWKDAELVWEGNTILFAGTGFEGHVDEEMDARDRLVVPGFIDTHVHSGHRASHRLISDIGRPDYFGQPFLEISVAREGTRVGGDVRYVRPDDKAASEALTLNARFTAAELLRNGITTFVEFGSQLKVQEALLEEIGTIGNRAYLGPGFDSGRWIGGENGKLVRVIDEAAGEREFELALDFIARNDGAHDGRVRGILVPREIETCTVDLMRKAAIAARERNLPVAIHAAYNIHEVFDIIREHQMTSIELLEHVGLMSPTLNIGHGNFTADNPLANYSGSHDLEIMGRHHCSISHCPVNVARRGRFLNSWQSYRKAGVNIALGTDTYPRDMILQMRNASYMGKIASHNLKAATAAEVFSAATLGGAHSVGRGDLGRLAPGAKADIVTIDLTGRDSLRYGPVRDPIKSLVDCGIGDDVDTVIVDGIVRMEGGRIPGISFADLRGAAQAAGERVWAHWQDWDPHGRTAEEMSPLSFPKKN
ncbi:chlorohydrolase family protein [Roseixanthobacter liquoris]|uniref:chlorohydrolase family protein n=1 Tax=Roseixanthobacter liquoris TaxID=3119921 RepID=UPI0037272443